MREFAANYQLVNRFVRRSRSDAVRRSAVGSVVSGSLVLRLSVCRKFSQRIQTRRALRCGKSLLRNGISRIRQSHLRHPLRSPPSCGPGRSVLCLRGHSPGCSPRCPVRYLPRNLVSNSAGCSDGCLLRCSNSCPAGCSARFCPSRSPRCPPRSSGRCLPGWREGNGLSYSEGRLPSCCSIGGGNLLGTLVVCSCFGSEGHSVRWTARAPSSTL